MGIISTLNCYRVNSEYKPLEAVLLYRPGIEIAEIKNPRDVLHLRKIDYALINEEYELMINLYRKLRINVYFIDLAKTIYKYKDTQYLFNLMYTRDLFFMTPEGAIVSKMAHRLRENEVRYAAEKIKAIGIPVIQSIKGEGSFEGSDALWINDGLVMIGIGNRTETKGFQQVRRELKNMGVSCIAVPIPKKVIHLLGAVQLVDYNLALVRTHLVNSEIIGILKENKINIVDIPESIEVYYKQSLNILTVSPREIIMPSDCPHTTNIYKSFGIKIIAQVKIGQLINGGGGLACATAVLSRKL